MSKTNKNGGLKNNSNQPQNQKPFDITMNEKLLFKDNRNIKSYINDDELDNLKCVLKNWFIPIITEQSDVDELLGVEPSIFRWRGLDDKYQTSKLYLEHTDKGKLSSVYVLINKGGTLYKVVSQKDYGVIKSRMKLNDKGKFVPYGKCDLVPFSGEYVEYDIMKGRGWNEDSSFIREKSTYVNGKKDGESFIFLKDKRWDFEEDFGGEKGYTYKDSKYHFELTTYVNGKKDGKYLHTKNEIYGNYINNKRVDEWEIKNKHLHKMITDINGINPQFTDSGLYEYGEGSVKVNYKNGELIGKYKTENGWEGELNYGKFDGVVKEIGEREYGDDDVPHIVIHYDNGKKNGLELHFNGGGGSPTHYFDIKFTEWVNGTPIRKMELGLYNQMMFPPMRRVFDSELTENDIKTIKKYFKEFDKETFLELYQIFSYEEYEYNSGGGRSIKKNYKTDYLDIKKEWKENDKYQNYWRTESRWNEMIVNEFNYPHYTTENIKDDNGDWVKYELLTPHTTSHSFEIESFVKDGKRYLVNGDYKKYEWVENDDSNPIVKDLKREKVRKFVEWMDKEYKNKLKREKEREIELQKIEKEKELKMKEEQKRKKKEEKELLKQKELEGVSLSSFPMD